MDREDEDFDALLAVAGQRRQSAGGTKRVRRVAEESPDDLSGDEGEQGARPGRKTVAAAPKKRRVVSAKDAGQVRAAC